MFKLRDWSIALFVATAAHVVVLAVAVLTNPDRAKFEKSAGPTFEVVGAEQLFSAIDAEAETSQESTPVEVLEELKPQTVKPEVLQVKPLEEPRLKELEEAPVDDALAVLPDKPKPVTAKKQEKKKKKQEKKKVVKKKKPKKKVKKGGKRTAASKKGGGARGRQRKAAGRANLSNYKGRVRAHLMRRRRGAGSARGTARVSFTVTASGGVAGVRASGSAALRSAAIRMVRSAAPFPRIPAGLPRRISVSVSLHFR